MRTARVIYEQQDDGAWTATSPDVPGYIGWGDTFEQARARTSEGLPWFADDQSLALLHLCDAPPAETSTEAVFIPFSPAAVSGVISIAEFSGRVASREATAPLRPMTPQEV